MLLRASGQPTVPGARGRSARLAEAVADELRHRRHGRGVRWRDALRSPATLDNESATQA